MADTANMHCFVGQFCLYEINLPFSRKPMELLIEFTGIKREAQQHCYITDSELAYCADRVLH